MNRSFTFNYLELVLSLLFRGYHEHCMPAATEIQDELREIW